MKKRLKLHPSNYFYFGMIAFLFIIDIISPIVGICHYLKFRSNTGIFLIIFFIVGSCFLSLLILLSEMKQWLSTIYLTDKYIKLRGILKKTKIMEYSKFCNVYYGFVCVRGIPEWFIIISNRKMSRFELENLNKIKQTDDFIKIEYSKKRREKLMEILPRNMACQLKNPPPGKK